LGQRDLARLAGTSQAQISRIECGETSPSLQTLTRLLATMGERLSLESVHMASNRQLSDLRADYEQLTPSERVAQTARLSRTLTGIAAARTR
jgi:transcriptional regulator with XRE-family HTH domain